MMGRCGRGSSCVSRCCAASEPRAAHPGAPAAKDAKGTLTGTVVTEGNQAGTRARGQHPGAGRQRDRRDAARRGPREADVPLPAPAWELLDLGQRGAAAGSARAAATPRSPRAGRRTPTQPAPRSAAPSARDRTDHNPRPTLAVTGRELAPRRLDDPRSRAPVRHADLHDLVGTDLQEHADTGSRCPEAELVTASCALVGQPARLTHAR